MSEETSNEEEVPQGAYLLAFIVAFAALCITMFVFPLWTV